MKRLLAFAFALFALAGMAQAAPATAAGPAMKLPPHTRVPLKNGLTLLLMEKKELPLVSFSFIVRAGSTADPQGKEGLASITAGLLRKGTKTRTADQLSQELDFIGGTFGADASLDYTSGEAEFMTKDIDKGTTLLADILTNPTFPQEEFAKLIRQQTDAVKAAKDEPGQVIGLYFRSYLYGSNAYGRPGDGTEQSLANITRADVLEFRKTQYAPMNTIIAVVGDFDTPKMRALLEQKFGPTAWPQPEGHAMPNIGHVDSPQPVTGSRLLLVNKPDATQTYFMIGNVGIARKNPDRAYIDVVNTLFGGRFTSFINAALRIQSGLTYGASSRFDQRLEPGPFYISTFTKNATTGQAMDMALEVLRKFKQTGITQEQLDSAKAYIRGQFPPTLETSNALARYMAQIEFYGLPANDLEDFFNKLNSMDLATSKRVIDQYFPEKNLVFVVVGKADEIAPVVKKYAEKVDTKNISDPGF